LEAALPAEDRTRAQFRESFVAQPAGKGIASISAEWGWIGANLRGSLLIIMAVTGLVLLIACANTASVLLAKAPDRQREIAIRLAMGASRARLIRQLLTESVLLSSGGAVVGLLVAQWTSRLLLRLLPIMDCNETGCSFRAATFDLSIDIRVLAFTAGATLITESYSASRRRFEPQEWTRTRSSSSPAVV
jgi:ABC-type antimicrobial peptide transport system permease subunit